MSQSSNYHQSVLLQECIDGLAIQTEGVYIDATFGGGGHSKEILKHLGPKGKLIAFDQDKDAWENVPDDPRIIFIPENFRYMKRFLRLHKIHQVNGVLADLGVSSHQFDEGNRGFSIRFNAELDMRMDQRSEVKAKDIVNQYSEKQLHKLFEQYGEVTNARTLAQTIVSSRQQVLIHSIADFKQAIASCVKGIPQKYFAQVFQALRIEVNAELEVLEQFCTDAIDILAPNGRICIISFHSLEDRIVKKALKSAPDQSYNPFVQEKTYKRLHLITSKPITASEEELKVNSRSRSAKLRIAQKQSLTEK
jgi:16S rRNA (cytosine1402-N4)-methyltransferase